MPYTSFIWFSDVFSNRQTGPDATGSQGRTIVPLICPLSTSTSKQTALHQEEQKPMLSFALEKISVNLNGGCAICFISYDRLKQFNISCASLFYLSFEVDYQIACKSFHAHQADRYCLDFRDDKKRRPCDWIFSSQGHLTWFGNQPVGVTLEINSFSKWWLAPDA